MNRFVLFTLAAGIGISGLILLADSQVVPSPPGPQQPADGPIEGTALGGIRGRVTSVATGAGLRAAIVLRSLGVTRRIVRTDDQGRYEVPALPTGRYTITAWKSGYLTLSFGQRRPMEGERPVEVSDSRWIDNINFALPKGGAIDVTVTDQFGEPQAGIDLQAQRYTFIDGGRFLTPTTTMTSFVSTDDRGNARLYNLEPGEYYVSAHVGTFIRSLQPPEIANSETYYPGTANVAEAKPVVLAVGQELAVNFALAPARMSRLAGTVRTSVGTPPQRLSVQLWQGSPNPSALGFKSRAIPSLADGSFATPNVVAGRYTLYANATLADGSQEFAFAPLSINGADVEDLNLLTSRGATVRGRYEFDGNAPTSSSRELFALTTRLDGVGANGRYATAADGAFELTGVIGKGVLRLAVPSAGASIQGMSLEPPRGVFIKAILSGANDITDTPTDFATVANAGTLRVLLTTRHSRVTGRVMDRQGRQVNDYAVIVFSENRERWGWHSRYVAVGRPDRETTFTIDGLPPGRYMATAVDYLEAGAEGDAGTLERLASQGIPIDIGQDESKTVTLTIRGN